MAIIDFLLVLAIVAIILLPILVIAEIVMASKWFNRISKILDDWANDINN